MSDDITAAASDGVTIHGIEVSGAGGGGRGRLADRAPDPWAEALSAVADAMSARGIGRLAVEVFAAGGTWTKPEGCSGVQVVVRSADAALHPGRVAVVSW